ncbi:MAG: hypothetical protein O2975_09155, partial [Proteobacteria bacterium]|nr:hypothetical protein [Pseudomonadota bacterium]
MPASPLSALDRIKDRYGADRARRKRGLLAQLARRRLKTAAQVLQLHEIACFLRAYPDDAAVRAQATLLLRGFARRSDLRAHRDALENSGIAGTAIRHAYFWPMFRWVARRWPRQLRLDRSDTVASQRIEAALSLLLTSVESEWLRERRPAGFAALDRLRPKQANDAVFLAHLIDALPGDGRTREAFHDAIEPFYELLPGPGTPSRTLAHHALAPAVHVRTGL